MVMFGAIIATTSISYLTENLIIPLVDLEKPKGFIFG